MDESSVQWVWIVPNDVRCKSLRLCMLVHAFALDEELGAPDEMEEVARAGREAWSAFRSTANFLTSKSSSYITVTACAG